MFFDQAGPPMTLEQLRALDAIVATGAFRAAAERLNKSQSAVSHLIRALEEELELPLFSRAGYRPVLTPAGEAFHREAVRVLRQTDALRRTAAALRARQEPELRVAVTATMPLDPVLAALGEIGALYPATHLRVTTEAMGGPVARLMADEADLALATLDGVPADAVEASPVAEITILPVASPALAPAQRPGLKTASEMQGYAQIVVAGTGGPEYGQSRDLLPGGKRWTVSDFQAKRQVILAGLGWGGMPSHLIGEELRDGRLVALEVEGFPPRHSRIFKIRRRARAVGVVAAALWERIGAE